MFIKLTYSLVQIGGLANPLSKILIFVDTHLELVSENGNEPNDIMGFEGSIESDSMGWKQHREVLKLVQV